MNWAYLLCAAWLLVVKAASIPAPCNQSVSSLSEMLEMVSGHQDLAPDFVLCVELRSTVEVLQYTATSIPFSVVLRPAVTGERGRVICNNIDKLLLSNYQQFPLLFNTSESVTIENIDFIGCMRPVQMLWIRRVTLNDTTFR